MWADVDDFGGLRQWRMAPLSLLFFVALSVYLTPGSPAVVSPSSLGFGFAVGLALVLPRRLWPWLTAGYFTAAVVFGVIAGRGVSVSIASGTGMTLIMLLLAETGRGIGLRRLAVPADALKLMAVAAMSGVLVPLLTVLNATIVGRGDELFAVLPQTALTGVTGILLTGSLVLAYEPGAYAVHGARRQFELFAVTAASLFWLIGIGFMDAQTIAGTSPLFLLVITLGWLGLRFGPALASVGLVFCSVWIGFGVLHGASAFVTTSSELIDAIVASQIYVAVLAGGVLMLAVYADHSRDQDTASRRSAQLLSSAADSAATQVFIKRYDPKTDHFTYTEVNENFAADLGLSPAEVIGHSDEDLHTPDAAERFHAQDVSVMTSGERQRFETSALVHGRQVSYYVSKFPVYDRNGSVIGVGGVSLDRTAERQRTALLQQVFTRSPVPTARLAWRQSAVGEVLEANEAFAALVGAAAADIVGRDLSFLNISRADLGALAPAKTVRREVRLRRDDGVELTVVATSTVVGTTDVDEPFALVIFEDVTATRAAEAGLVHRATHDPLTDLLNRQALVERLAARAVGSGNVPRGTALWCCDLDGFKQFNDSLGHDTGDRVLLAMADRVRAAVGSEDTVGRLGADEFVVVSGRPLTESEAIDMAARIRDAVRQPLEMDGRTHSLQVSVGVAVSSGDGGAQELLRQADVALTRAKDLGRDRVEVYLPDLDRRVQLRVAMRETLVKGLAENRIEVHAQPVVDVATGRTTGAEALVRLRDLDGTVLPPAAFIPVAEESGLIVPLGLRVLDLALALCARWSERETPLEIAVNVSPRQLENPEFVATVATLLQIHQVPPHRLVLEVTESTVVDAAGPTLDVLHSLRATGVHVAIDDFGTGYSSLASLRDLPADIVKIDRSFVSGLCVDEGDEAIVRAVLAMAHATSRAVVAEGVETPEQAQRLVELNCDRVQGYYFSRPLPPIDFDPEQVFTISHVPARDPLDSERSHRP